jgi:biotin transport system substrate-specific component
MEKNLSLIALFAALIAVLGLIPKLDLISGVPITAQSLGIMLCGTVLGARRGALAVLVFLGLTLAGLPLLSGGRGGLAVLAGPSVGYIIGFPIAAFVTGLITERLKTPILPAATIAAFLGGFVVLNILGIIGMSVMLDKSLAEAAALALPFAIGDTIKSVLAGLITQTIARARPEALLSRESM